MDKARIGEMLRQLVAADGPAGSEARVQPVVRDLLQPYTADIRTDAVGNLIARVPGADPAPGSVLLAAHLDEIGLIVTKVEGEFLSILSIGGVDPRGLLGQEVTVYPGGPAAARYPQGIPGYVGYRPPHLLTPEEREKVIPFTDLRVDVGFDASGVVQVGDRIAMVGPYTELLNGRAASKALDNRASVASMIAALGYLQGLRHTWDVYAVATAQEEVGSRGATPGAYDIEPSIAIAIDVTFANTPGVDDRRTLEADAGPSLAIGPNLHPGIVKALRAAAESIEMHTLDEPTPGHSGTDAWAIQMVRGGIPCGLVSIPVRYMHSTVETVVLADVDRTARLLATFISRLDSGFLAGLAEEV